MCCQKRAEAEVRYFNVYNRYGDIYVGTTRGGFATAREAADAANAAYAYPVARIKAVVGQFDE